MLTPTLSEADALIVTVPLTFALLAGALSATLGALVSGAPLLTDTVTLAEFATFPAASYALELSVWEPLATVEVFQL